jgi:hypothetical protein
MRDFHTARLSLFFDSMISISIAQSEADVRAILALQQVNLQRNVPAEIRTSDGFVTVEHQPDTLQRMNRTMPSVIAQDASGQLIGYTLSMLPEFAVEVPELHSLFSTINTLAYKDKPMQDFTYYMMGQACVASGFRGQKLLSRMLHKHRELYSDRYELIITSISNKNPRSIRAHTSVGFTAIHSFYDAMSDEIWYILLWDWRLDMTS